MCPQSNNNLSTIHRFKCLRGSFGIQIRGYETLMELKTEEGCFEKAGLCPGGKLTSTVPATDPQTALSPYRFGDSPIWSWSCHQHHPTKGLWRSHSHQCLE